MSMGGKHCLVYDLGLFTENAVRLARDCASVKYYVPWRDAFPEPFKAIIGDGLEGIERVDSFEAHLDSADFVFIPDTLCASKVEWLKKHGYPVAGAGAAEKLELDRWHGRTRQKENGLPVQETHRVKGVAALRRFIKDHKGYFIKIDTFRGVEESFRHIDERQTEPTVDRLACELGPYKEEVVFICEELVPGVEPGIDAVTWEGRTLYPACIGYEKRGGLIERVYGTEGEMPEAARRVDEGLSPEFRRHGTRFFYSAEFRIGRDRTPYLIDPTIRLAAPGVAAIQTELFENYTEVVYGLATGAATPPVTRHRYAAAIAFESEEAKRSWVNIGFPKEMRRWVKLRMAVRKGADYYAVPGFESLGTVIGLADTAAGAAALASERAAHLRSKRLNVNEGCLASAMEDADKGRSYGIEF